MKVSFNLYINLTDNSEDECRTFESLINMDFIIALVCLFLLKLKFPSGTPFIAVKTDLP